MPTENMWRRYRHDFNRMTDNDVDIACEKARAIISDAEEEQEWLMAVEYWKRAGRPRD